MLSSKKIFLEVISSSPSDSQSIQQHAADRIQLVSALQIGGVTPSPTIIRKSLEAVSIPTHVIVRHHNNGFVYGQDQKKWMMEDIIELRDRYHVPGVVVGGLQTRGDQLHVDIAFVSQVLKQCGGKTKVTFHKASDHTSNFSQGIKILSELNVDQILTQGSPDNILSAKSLQNIRQVDPSIKSGKILAGGGISHANVQTVVDQWGVRRVHIGTCVRKAKYGTIDRQSLVQFRKILDKIQ